MRLLPRVTVNLPVTLSGWGNKGAGAIHDISLGGTLVKLKDPIKTLKLVNLSFSINGPNLTFNILSRLLRYTATGFAAEFLDLDKKTRASLWDALLHFLPDSWHECPFCGQPLSGNGHKACKECSRPINFHNGGYRQVLEQADNSRPAEIIGQSQAMQRVFAMIAHVAATEVPVLIYGPPGSGKKMTARAIHQRSRRSEKPFIVFDCTTLAHLDGSGMPSDLSPAQKNYSSFESACEQAQGGTLLLKQIDRLPTYLQAKLLLILEATTSAPEKRAGLALGNLRIIATNTYQLKPLVREGKFLEELYYLLNIATIDLPPLKEREDDVFILAKTLLKQYAQELGKELYGFIPEMAFFLQDYPWPGNIRELKNRIQRAAVLSDGPWVGLDKLGISSGYLTIEACAQELGIEEASARFEAYKVAEALMKAKGHVPQAAKILNISRSEMYKLVKKYELKDNRQNYLNADADSTPG